MCDAEPCVEQSIERLREVVLASPVDASVGSASHVEADVLKPALRVPDVLCAEGQGVLRGEGHVAIGVAQFGAGVAVGRVDREVVGKVSQ